MTHLNGCVNIILVKNNVVIIEERIHLFPFRTQKLSSLSLMVLGAKAPGRVGRSHVKWPVGQAVKTPPFHGGNRSSILLRVTNLICGCSSMVEFWPSKPAVRVRSPSPAPKWGYSSAGRASALQAGGHRFEPC